MRDLNFHHFTDWPDTDAMVAGNIAAGSLYAFSFLDTVKRILPRRKYTSKSG